VPESPSAYCRLGCDTLHSGRMVHLSENPHYLNLQALLQTEVADFSENFAYYSLQFSPALELQFCGFIPDYVGFQLAKQLNTLDNGSC